MSEPLPASPHHPLPAPFDAVVLSTEAANGLLRLALFLTPCLPSAALALSVALARVCERAGMREDVVVELLRAAHRASAAVGEDDQ